MQTGRVGAQSAERKCETMDILQKIKEAQEKLRATQLNWQEECLFDCDDILTEVIAELEKQTDPARDG